MKVLFLFISRVNRKASRKHKFQGCGLSRIKEQVQPLSISPVPIVGERIGGAGEEKALGKE